MSCLTPDKIKDQVIAKIAMQAADLYADAITNMQAGSVKSMWDKVQCPVHCVCMCVWEVCVVRCVCV